MWSVDHGVMPNAAYIVRVARARRAIASGNRAIARGMEAFALTAMIMGARVGCTRSWFDVDCSRC